MLLFVSASTRLKSKSPTLTMVNVKTLFVFFSTSLCVCVFPFRFARENYDRTLSGWSLYGSYVVSHSFSLLSDVAIASKVEGIDSTMMY
jgi:hypothetical protein